MEEALKLIQGDTLTYIIGGGEIYDLGMPYADVLEITRVHESFEADTFFPQIDEKIWKLTQEEFHSSDERHKFNFTYLTFQRR
jgi:dihydrofolate reductase